MGEHWRADVSTFLRQAHAHSVDSIPVDWLHFPNGGPGERLLAERKQTAATPERPNLHARPRFCRLLAGCTGDPQGEPWGRRQCGSFHPRSTSADTEDHGMDWPKLDVTVHNRRFGCAIENATRDGHDISARGSGKIQWASLPPPKTTSSPASAVKR